MKVWNQNKMVEEKSWFKKKKEKKTCRIVNPTINSNELWEQKSKSRIWTAVSKLYFMCTLKEENDDHMIELISS